ncbi:hypothetical protein JNUCC0626_38235 [Lentzea sp. JNUCC 0626]|uniref:hypothetical protein n=1 Tax=Lentzea sp. JNUCC 0626 TaxID=3367513 RepID=UPI003749BA70
MRFWVVAYGLVGLLIVLLSGVSCSPERNRAEDYATKTVEGQLDGAAGRIEWAVQGGADMATVDAAAGMPHSVFGRRPIEGGFELDVVFRARGEAGGGWTYTTAWARSCVRYSVYPGPSPVVDAAALDCPHPLAPGEHGYGQDNVTVEYEPTTAPRTS